MVALNDSFRKAKPPVTSTGGVNTIYNGNGPAFTIGPSPQNKRLEEAVRARDAWSLASPFVPGANYSKATFANVKAPLRKILVLAILLWIGLPATSPAFDHEKFDAVLAGCVEDGRVHYGKLRGLEPTLDAYLASLASAKPSLESGPELRAFWIDAYNACVLKGLLDAYPVGRPQDIPGFFDVKRYEVEGQKLTLNDIENEKIRGQDPRIHFALICGAASCPDMRTKAWRGATLEADLDQGVRQFLANTDKGVRLDGDGALVISQLFRWFAKDFGGESGVLAFLAKYGPPAVAPRAAQQPPPPIRFLDYDWALNAVELKGARKVKLW